MAISNLIKTIAKPLLTSPIKSSQDVTSVVLKSQPTHDIHCFTAIEKLQKEAFERLAQKLDIQTVKKSDVAIFLDNFSPEDKEYAQELLFQSADSLTMQGLVQKSKMIDNDSTEKINLNLEGAALSYIKQKSVKYPYGNCTIDALEKAIEKRAFHPSQTIQLVGKIYSEPLTRQEVKTLAQTPKIEIYDNGFEHKLNFFDFAIDSTGSYAKKKASQIIERAKLQADAASPKEAIAMAIDEVKEENLKKINKARKKNGLPVIQITQPPQSKEITSLEELTNHLTQNAGTAEKLREQFQQENATIIKEPNFLRLLSSDNGFTFYTPKKTFEALRNLSEKMHVQLQKDNIASNDVFFITRNKDKSDKMMGYMLSKLGDFDESQFLSYQQANKLAEDGFFKDKAVAFLDDINGSGDTVNELGDELGGPLFQAKALYVTHLISYEKARKNINPLNQNITHIYHQNGINIDKPEHPVYKEFSSLGDFIMLSNKWASYENTGATQGFFFSIPDNLINAIRFPVEKFLESVNIPLTNLK